ncbi:MAG: S1/P1 nuclease [Prevotella sp.]|nr:S1/P1 nuclease [Bacteroides sp.]MCM1365907.1 S1/P1 nuclease [Prevotella sp.]
MNKLYLTAAVALITSLSAGAWGQKGHDTTAFIAENHLTEKSRKAINELLDGKSIVYWANWLDNASHTAEYDYTKTWHYKNIDDGITFEDAPLNKKGDIVSALNKQIEILSNPKSSKEKKQLALKIVVHLLGDLHQPMHMGHATDLGGNRVPVYYFERKTNLHSAWDSSLPEAAHKWSYTEWQSQLDRVSDSEESEILNGNVEDWAKETYKICTDVYRTTPENYTIKYDYIAQWTPIIEQQFLKAGLRLADILNKAFDSEYISPAKK